jgi:hypothetical protein
MLGVDDALLAMTSYTARYPSAWAPSGEMATPAPSMAAHTWWRSMALTPELQQAAVKTWRRYQLPACVSATGQTMTMCTASRNCSTAARAERRVCTGTA